MSTAAPCPDPVSTGNIPLPTPEQLPDDPETLKRLLVELMATLREERRDKEALQHRLSEIEGAVTRGDRRLLDLEFLAWQSAIWPLAARSSAARELLACQRRGGRGC